METARRMHVLVMLLIVLIVLILFASGVSKATEGQHQDLQNNVCTRNIVQHIRP